jgi:hypothetical protein
MEDQVQQAAIARVDTRPVAHGPLLQPPAVQVALLGAIEVLGLRSLLWLRQEKAQAAREHGQAGAAAVLEH